MRSFIIPSRGSRIQPSDDFIEQMRTHAADEVSEAPFVPCPDFSTDFHHLTDAQLRYYLQWRHQLRNGNMIKSDYGYEYIRICELINLSEERENISHDLKILFASKETKLTNYQLMTIEFDASVAFRLPVRRYCRSDAVRKEVSRSVMLTTPISYIDDPDSFCNYPFGDNYYMPDNIEDFYVRSLRSLDAYLIDMTGKGIVDTYGGGTVASQVEVFKDYFYEGERLYRLNFKDTSNNSQAIKFIGAVLRCCESIRCKSEGEKGPTVPSILTKEMRSIIEREFTGEPDPYPEEDKFIDASRIGDDGDSGILIIPENRKSDDIYSRLRGDIEEYRNRESPVACKYVPSEVVNKQYSKMTDEQLSYYLYWRTCARSGKYLTTDIGYVWLYLCELINSDDDPHKVYDSIIELGNAYERSTIRVNSYSFFSIDYDHLIMRTALDYAIVKEMELPEDDVYPCNITVNSTMHRILMGDNLHLSPEAVVFLCSATKSQAKDVDSEVADVFVKALREAHNNSNSSNGAISYCRMSSRTVKVAVFESLKYYGYPKNRPISYPVTFYDFANNKIFEENCKELLKAILRAVKAHRQGKKLPSETLHIFGAAYDGIAGILQAQPEKASKPVRSKKIKLDATQIMEAEDALNRTTELMFIGEEHQDEKPIPSKNETDNRVQEAPKKSENKAEAPKADVVGPWDSLLDSLEEEEIRVLMVMAIDPSGKSVSRILPKTIDSINSHAIDIIGDAIIESGRFVEEYESDIKAALVRRMRWPNPPHPYI